MNSLNSTNLILDKQNLQIEKQDADFKSAQNILMEKHDADFKSLSTDHSDLLSKMDELGMQVQRYESVHAYTYNGDVPLEISGGTTASPNSNARTDEDTGRPIVAEGQASELWKEQIIGYLVKKKGSDVLQLRQQLQKAKTTYWIAKLWGNDYDYIFSGSLLDCLFV